MKSLASIFFITLFLAQGIAPCMDLCCELQKLPNLFEHYEDHKERNDSSFWQFLVNHFVNTDEHPKDHDDTEHQDLPFQGGHQCCHPPVFYVPDVSFTMTVPEHVVQMKFHFHNALHSSELPDSPFQPPRV